MVLAYLLLAAGVLVEDGRIEGLPLVLGATALVGWRIARPAAAARPDRALLGGLLAVGLLGLVRPPGVYLVAGTSRLPFWIATAALAALGAIGLLRPAGPV